MTLVGFLRRIVRLLRPYRAAGVVIVLGLLLEMAFMGVVPLSFKYLIDHAIPRRDRSVLLAVLAGLTASVVVIGVAGIGRDYLYARVTSRALNDLRTAMFAHPTRLPAHFYARARVGDVLARFSADLASVEHALLIRLVVGGASAWVWASAGSQRSWVPQPISAGAIPSS